MRPILRHGVLVALSTALMLSGRPARAAAPVSEPVPVPRLIVDGPVHAGDEVEVRWASPGAGVEELEVLLSLDDGRSWHVRVSPSLTADRTRWRWRVPNLPSGEARLRIRMRADEREIEGEAGGRFTIVGDPSRPLTRALFCEGGWWSGPEAPLAPPPAGLGRDHPASLSATHPATSGEDAPPLAMRPRGTGVVGRLDVARAFAPPAADRSHAGAPEVYPLRN